MKIKLFLYLLLAFTVMPAIGSTPVKTLNIAIIQEWSAFNPINNQLASNEAIFPFILRKMVKRSASGGVLPDVAESIPSLKDKTAIWTIKKNAQWADGTPVVCADWHLAWQAGMNPNVSTDARSLYEKIQNIEWSNTNPKSCKVTYSSADWSYDRDLPPLIPAHLEKTILEKFKNEPQGFDRNSNFQANPTLKGLYNGPYFVSEFKLGSHIILTRNENFYGKKPQIERIIFKHISDTNALKANLLSGQVAAVSAVGFPPDTAINFDEEFKKNGAVFGVRFQNSGIFQGVYFNLSSEVFKDVKVREALSRSINKESIVQAFFYGKLQAAESILSPQHPSYEKKQSQYSKDKAIKLLDAAGWKIGKTGIREKNGKQLSFIFKTSAGLKVLENIQVYLCEQFKSIGAQCIIKNEPPRILLGQSVPHGEFDMAMYGQPVPPDTSLKSYFGSKEIPNEKNSWAGGNSIRLNSKTLDVLLESFDKENNFQKRNQIVKKIEEEFIKNYYLIPLYHRREAIVMPKNLSGLTDSFEGTNFNDPENWILN